MSLTNHTSACRAKKPADFDRSRYSPDDRLEAAVAELRATTGTELLEVLSQVSPKFFETIVLDVLHKMGYGTSRSDLQRVGGSGDGGIDGVIALDRLGLEKVYVQAKRWQNSVWLTRRSKGFMERLLVSARTRVFLSPHQHLPAGCRFRQVRRAGCPCRRDEACGTHD